MRLATFKSTGRELLGLVAESDQMIDLAEVHRRYLKGGTPPYVGSLQAFIEGGGQALSAAKKRSALRSRAELRRPQETGAGGHRPELSSYPDSLPHPPSQEERGDAGYQLPGAYR